MATELSKVAEEQTSENKTCEKRPGENRPCEECSFENRTGERQTGTVSSETSRNLSALLSDIRDGNYQGAIFDIDGTLIDSMPIWLDVDARYLRTLGIELTEEEQQEVMTTIFPMTVEEGTAYLKERFALPLSTQEIATGIFAIVADFYKNEVPLKPGVEWLLKELKQAGVPMVLATVGHPDLEMAALTRLGVAYYFLDILCCSELNTSKHEPLIYNKARDIIQRFRAQMGRPEQDASGGKPSMADSNNTSCETTEFSSVDAVAHPDTLTSEEDEAVGISAELRDNSVFLVFEDVLHAVRTANEAGYTTVAVEDAASAKDKERLIKEATYYWSGS